MSVLIFGLTFNYYWHNIYNSIHKANKNRRQFEGTIDDDIRIKDGAPKGTACLAWKIAFKTEISVLNMTFVF